MIRVMFVCHGNICRSPMAEFVLKDMVQKRNIAQNFEIASSATSTEALGMSVHRGTTQKLALLGISTEGKTSVQLKKSDYDKYDYIFCMDSQNMRNAYIIIGKDKLGKMHRFLDASQNPRDIADPWYTGNFDETYDDILEGCEIFLQSLNF